MFLELLKQIADGLDAAHIPYMVIGGQAVLVHGEPRLTRDIDITLGTDTSRLEELLLAVERMGLSTLVTPEEFANETMVLPCEDRVSRIRVDFVFSTSTYEREAIGRAVTIEILGTGVRFVGVEDLVIHKVIAGRPRDLEDVRSILTRHAGLDHEFVRRTLLAFQEALSEPFVQRFDDVAETNGE